MDDVLDCFLTEEEMSFWDAEIKGKETPKSPRGKSPPFMSPRVVLSDLQEVGQLSDSSYATMLLFIAIHHQVNICRSAVVSIPRSVAAYFCLGRPAVSRGLKVLERAGFLKILGREPGSLLLVSLVPRDVRLARKEGQGHG
jgi:hypothetical protein